MDIITSSRIYLVSMGENIVQRQFTCGRQRSQTRVMRKGSSNMPCLCGVAHARNCNRSNKRIKQGFTLDTTTKIGQDFSITPQNPIRPWDLSHYSQSQGCYLTQPVMPSLAHTQSQAQTSLSLVPSSPSECSSPR